MVERGGSRDRTVDRRPSTVGHETEPTVEGVFATFGRA
jgi:hypothetical protein